MDDELAPSQPLVIYLDWNVVVDFSQGHFHNLRRFLLDEQSQGTLIIPYTEVHLEEIFNTENSPYQKREELIQQSIEELSKLTKDNLLEISSDGTVARISYQSMKLRFEAVSVLSSFVERLYFESDYEQQKKAKEQRKQYGFDPGILNNANSGELFELIKNIADSNLNSSPEETPVGKQFLEQFEKAEPQIKEGWSILWENIQELVAVGGGKINVDETELFDSMLSSTKKIIENLHITPYFHNSFQENSRQCWSAANNLVEVIKSTLSEHGVALGSTEPELSLFHQLFQEYSSLEGFGVWPDRPRKTKNLSRSQLLDAKHAAVAICAGVYISRDKRHTKKCKVLYEKHQFKTDVVWLEEAPGKEREVILAIQQKTGQLTEIEK